MRAATLGSTAPLLTGGDITLLGRQIPFWPALVTTALVLILAAAFIRLAAGALRGKSSADVLTVVAAAMASSVAATGMWHFFSRTMHLPMWVQAVLFAFMEISVLASALRARASVAKHGQAGADGLAVWVLTSASGFMSASEAGSPQEALVRLGAPLVAAWLWERSMVPERRARRAAEGRAENVRWLLSYKRIAVRLGLATALVANLETEDANRRIDRFVRADNRAQRAGWLTRRHASSRRARAHAHLMEQARMQADPRALYAHLGRQAILDVLARLGGDDAVIDRERARQMSHILTDTREPEDVAVPEPKPERPAAPAGELPTLAALVVALASHMGTAHRSAPPAVGAQPAVDAPAAAMSHTNGTGAPIFVAPNAPVPDEEPSIVAGSPGAPRTMDQTPDCGDAGTVGAHPHTGRVNGAARPEDLRTGSETETGSSTQSSGTETGGTETFETETESSGTETETGGTETFETETESSGTESETGGTETETNSNTQTSGTETKTETGGTETETEQKTSGNEKPRRGGGPAPRTDAEKRELARLCVDRLDGAPVTVESVRVALSIGRNTAAEIRKLILEGGAEPAAQTEISGTETESGSTDTEASGTETETETETETGGTETVSTESFETETESSGTESSGTESETGGTEIQSETSGTETETETETATSAEASIRARQQFTAGAFRGAHLVGARA